jgi:hypothetical protein
MSKAVLLHIGTMKTGTTSIQTWLAEAQKQGSLTPVCYPLWPGDRCHERLAMLYQPYEDWAPWMRQAYPSRRRQMESLRRQYRRFLFGELRSAGDAVLSAEALSYFSPRLVAQLRDDLESLGFRDFRVVLYIRDPAEFYISSAQQRLRVHIRPPLVKDPVSFRYNFRRMTETWEQAFPDRLIVRKFSSDPSLDVIDDFANLLKQYLGVSLPRAGIRENTSLSAEGMQILQDYRETFWPDSGGIITPDVARLVSFLLGPARDIPQHKPVLKEQVAAQVRANHKGDADELYRRYGLDLGLRDLDPIAPLPPRQTYRVEDIVQSVDPRTVGQILLRLAPAGLGGSPAERSRAVAGAVYRRIPPAHRPERLAEWLRSHL